ncbi:MAG: glycosyltransferase involved in cell wall biosynthesis [Marivirga sp.]|jgi:glycosyltransferase involved in cell wall biosynthesis
MHFYSVIIPVYNRPQEVRELLESLTKQSYKQFEVLIVEDGSDIRCEDICKSFQGQLDVSYFYKENTGQGFSRNYGFQRAKGDYFIVFDSDCIIPSNYFELVEVSLSNTPLDAFGGPDAALDSFTDTQKAISYSMTSFFTTGGIRGGKVQVGTFRPRSFNMGISKEVFGKIGGYIITRMAEDLEFSIRIEEAGFKMGLISEAKVYHKRRTNLRQFYKQLFFFGRGRINIFRFYKSELQLMHFFPAAFTVGILIIPLLRIYSAPMSNMLLGSYLLYAVLIFGDSLFKTNQLKVALISIAAAFTQLVAYGLGFLKELANYLIKRTD